MTKLITAIPQRLATNHTTYFRTEAAVSFREAGRRLMRKLTL
jgi:hypothetical protein